MIYACNDFSYLSEMINPFEGLPSNQEDSNIDSTSTSNIPISDFRRNEARPILADDGKLLFFFLFPLFVRILIRST